MPIIFQQSPLPQLQIAVWHISEPLSFFEKQVAAQRSIEHPQVKLRHLAARHLLLQLRPEFSLHNIVLAASGKPLVEDASFHFSLTHCADHAAAIVSAAGSVGIDLEKPGDRIFRIRHKFLSDSDQDRLLTGSGLSQLQEGPGAASWLTRCWSAKESIFKWYGEPGVDFREHMRLEKVVPSQRVLQFLFTPTGQIVQVSYELVQGMELTWVGSVD
jgi:4'-phosphopantetheinyl transferase